MRHRYADFCRLADCLLVKNVHSHKAILSLRERAGQSDIEAVEAAEPLPASEPEAMAEPSPAKAKVWTWRVGGPSKEAARPRAFTLPRPGGQDQSDLCW